MTNSLFTGKFTDAVTGLGVPGATADIAENMGWRDTTDASGVYDIQATPGNYTMGASAAGYFPQYTSVSIAQNETVTTNFSLMPMSSGTVKGTAWINSSLVISQVVVSTVQAGMGNFAAQYIELYNPTPNAVSVNGGVAGPSIKVNFQSAPGCGDASTCDDPTFGIKLNYVNDTVAPFGFYVIANTGTFMVNGVTVTADAVYAPNANAFCTAQPATWNTGGTPPVMAIMSQLGHGGDVWLSDSSGNLIDQVGWSHGANSHPNCSPYCIPFASGFQAGAEIVRTSSPNYASSVWGPAYDTSISSIDFVYPPIIAGFPYQPFSTLSPAAAPIAGRPAFGAVVTSNDSLSNSTAAYSVGYPPVADFTLVGVATATSAAPWSVLITSHGLTLENDFVTIPTQGSVYTFPSSTTILNLPSTEGFIAGTVADVLGSVITSPSAIKVSGGGTSVTAVNGHYLLPVSSGSVDVTANPSSANKDYVSVSSLAVTVQLGEISDGVDFQLSQGGQISGFVTRDGINALPGVAVSMIDSNGFSHDTEITNSAGQFTTIVIATGAYEVTPELDSLEISSPTYQNSTVAGGSTVFSTTFTITGAMGTVTGVATAGGKAISTGVLIVVTTSTLAGTPPAPPTISSATLTANSYYIGSSLEDGTFSISVRQSTSPAYNIYGYYTTVNSTGAVTFQSLKLTGVSVLAGQTVSGKNLAW
jgi:hypothetical protein